MIYSTEAELCRDFTAAVREHGDWTPYPETCGWDVVLVHKTGVQIGIEAKLKLNPKVMVQALPRWAGDGQVGPDFRAVLVGAVAPETRLLAQHLGLTVIWPRSRAAGERIVKLGNWATHTTEFMPKPPAIASEDKALREYRNLHWWFDEPSWADCAPIRRLELPDYVPDVAAGVPAPVVCGAWKIAAMRVCVLLARRGHVTRADFAHLKLSMSRWTQWNWLSKGPARGLWVAGPRLPAQHWRGLHPRVWSEIEADFDRWAPPASAQGALL